MLKGCNRGFHGGIDMFLNDVSAKSLTWFAALVLAIGMLIGSPTGQFFIALLAGCLAAIPLALGNRRRRIYAGIVFLLAVLFAVAVFDAYRHDSSSYRDRVKRAADTSSPAESR